MNHPTSFLLASAFLVAAAGAQTWQISRVANQLDHPTGIATNSAGTVYFTELPTPGLPGAMGGRNRVIALDVASGSMTTLTAGEPEPVNLAYAANGDLYWTCRSAGVVLRRSAGAVAPFLTMLPSPSGIAALADGRVAVTFVPTPGVPGTLGGTNRVGLVTQGVLSTLNMGEPEPVDIAATPAGDMYWTCRTAGVILRRDGQSGAIAPALRGLESPTGIAADGLGNLYFTEVPTPGVPGPMGGRNRIWKFTPTTQDLTLISMGEPEPTDVAVSMDGNTVYWTCTSAGVILRAVRTGSAPTVTSLPAAMGGTLRSFLHAPAAPGAMYLAASAARIGSVLLPDGRGVGLAMDSLFYGTLLNAGAPQATGYVGVLDSNGMGTTQLVLPNAPGVQGLSIYTAFLTIDPAASMGIGSISASHRTVVQ